MIMKVDGQATPLSRFSSDGPMLKKIVFGSGGSDVDAKLRELDAVKQSGSTAATQAARDQTAALQGIQASDTPADLTRALGAAADALRDRPNPLIVLISDGAYPESQLGLVSWDVNKPVPPTDPKAAKVWDAKNLATVDLSSVDVRYLPVGKRSDNVGIIAFNVRRTRQQGRIGGHRDPELRQGAKRNCCSRTRPVDSGDHSRRASASARSTRSCRRAMTRLGAACRCNRSRGRH
jgi:hypothetical protein